MIQYRYYEDTFCSLLPREPSQGTVVLLPDFPDTDTYTTAMKWLSRRDYTAVYPRYKGSMQSHGSFLHDHPGDVIRELVSSFDDVVFLGVGFGSLVGLSAASHPSVNGLVVYEPWWDVDLLEDPEDYFESAFKHHHYLYRDQRSDLPTSLRAFKSLYPFRYTETVNVPVLAFVSNNAVVPVEAAEEMRSLLDVDIVEHSATSMEQCFIQNMDRVYSFLNKVML